MAIDAVSQRTRRAVFAGAVGNALATVTTAIGQVSPVRAAESDAVILGQTNDATGITKRVEPPARPTRSSLPDGERMSFLSGALRRGVPVVLGLILLAAAAAAPVVAAEPTQCLVVNPTLDSTYRRLQAAINAAPAGAKLRVKGTCVGPITVSRDLKIVGKSGRGFGRATIDGDHRGSVLTIQSRTTVTIRGLLVTNGTAPMGGGIYAQPSSVRLVDTVVKGNSATGLDSASGGGGVAIDGGILTLVDSTIRHNTAAAHGGGIYVGLHGGADLFARGTSSVRGNHAGLDGGGIYIQTHSRATFSDSSSIAGNAADQRGGGVTCGDCGGVTLSGDSSIHDNTAGVGGGGLQSGGTGVPLQMQDRSSIHDNTAPIGGGVWLVLAVSLRMSGTSAISGNTASVEGGGAYLVLSASIGLADASSIDDNTAVGDGGGAWLGDHTSLAVGATASVSGNSATRGGGLFLEPMASASLSASDSVTANSPDNCYPPGVVVACTP